MGVATGPALARRRLPDGFRVAIDPRVRFRAAGRVLSGGSPWRILRLADAALPFVAELRRAGPAGAVPHGAPARTVARSLLDRGFAHPVLPIRSERPQVDVVVPFLGHPAALADCLAAIGAGRVIVVDDGSPDPAGVDAVVRRHGAHLERHLENRGPAAARNTGVACSLGGLVAFVDADCRPRDGWLERLVGHFDDPGVAAVAPRIRPAAAGSTLLARYEAARSALDMGAGPGQVRAGGRIGFVPTAALVVRREVALAHRFDEGLRLGEDVDFCWRLTEAGWLVRYEPAATVLHEPRLGLPAWIGRRVAYGTSAGALARRHPGRLAPARPSAWNLAALALVARGRPCLGAAVTAVSAVLLHRRLAPLGLGPSVAASTVAGGLVADGAGLGHAMRREWWPVGALCLSRSARSRPARLAAALMLGPLVVDWVRTRPLVDPAAYVALRLLDDAAYGTGVIAGALGDRTLAPLLPEVRLPPVARRRSPGAGRIPPAGRRLPGRPPGG